MLVLWGVDHFLTTVDDAWILDVDTLQWTKVRTYFGLMFRNSQIRAKYLTSTIENYYFENEVGFQR